MILFRFTKFLSDFQRFSKIYTHLQNAKELLKISKNNTKILLRSYSDLQKRTLIYKYLLRFTKILQGFCEDKNGVYKDLHRLTWIYKDLQISH